MMHCPHCKSRAVHKYVNPKGRLSYLCQSCQRIFQKSSRKKTLSWIAGLLIFFVLSPGFVNKALQIIIARSSNTDEPVDAIVVLGRGPKSNGDRTLAAAQLWTEGRASTVFMSGMTDAPVMIKLAQDMGVSANKISGERCSQSTWENALFSDILLKSQGPQKILLVTDDIHIPRAALTFRGFGFEVIPHPVQSSLSIHQIRNIFRESFGLVFYLVSGKLQPPKADAAQLARTEANSKINEWNCRLPNR